MNRNISKFERMVKFQKNKLDKLKQQMAREQSTINGLNIEYEKLAVLFEETTQQNTTLQAIASLQQIELALSEIQKRIKKNRQELAARVETFQFLRDAYLEQDRTLKSWEKLVEQETDKKMSAENRIEMQQADETYLITRHGSDQR